MDSAILKGDLLRSGPYQRLSRDAQLLFLSAITATDDYARIDSDAYWWRANVCPQFEIREIQSAFSELLVAGFLVPYEVAETVYFLVPYVQRTSRFNFRYSLKAKYPNPETGDIEEPATYGELCKVGWQDGSQASEGAKDQLRSAAAVREHCIGVVGSSSLKSPELKIQHTTHPQCARSAGQDRPLLDVVETDLTDLERRILNLSRVGASDQAIIKAMKSAPTDEVAEALAVLRARRMLKDSEG